MGIRKAEIDLKREQTAVEKVKEENRKTELDIEKIKLLKEIKECKKEIKTLKEKLKAQEQETPSDGLFQFIDDEDEYEILSETHEFKDGLAALTHKI